MIDKIEKLVEVRLLNSRHPNADPLSGKYCVPPDLFGMEISESLIENIEQRMKVFNLCNCYYVPFTTCKIEGGYDCNGDFK